MDCYAHVDGFAVAAGRLVREVLRVGANLCSRRGIGTGITHAFLEISDCAAEVAANVFEFLGAENHHNDEQHDKQLPN